jgi:acetoacetate decarboxylase
MVLKSVPIYGSLYPEPPYIYHGTRLLLVLYNIKRESIPQEVLHENFKISKRPLIMMFITDYPDSTIGPYYEAATFIEVKYKGDSGNTRGLYCNSMFVDSDIAMAAGREIWGFPKKYAEMQLKESKDKVIGTLKRKGSELIKATINLEEKVESMPVPEVPIITIRQFFEPGGNSYALRQVQAIDMELEPEIITKGAVKVEFPEKSDHDPIYFLEPESILGGFYMKLSKGVLPYGRII